MTAVNFDAALARVLAHEGGYTNHPSDPGGPTNFGITIADYRKYVKSDAKAADVRKMVIDDAKKIYRQEYWQVLRCDDLSSGVDYAVFDYGVNSGTGRAGKVLCHLLNLPVNSAVDDTVVAAIARADSVRLIEAICDERLAFLQSLKTWPVFGAGWSRRVAQMRVAALAMAKADSALQEMSSSTAAGAAAATGAAVAVGTAVHSAGIASPAAIVIVIAAMAVAFAGTWLVWRILKDR